MTVMEDAIEALSVMLDSFAQGHHGTDMELQIHLSNAGAKPGCPS